MRSNQTPHSVEEQARIRMRRHTRSNSLVSSSLSPVKNPTHPSLAYAACTRKIRITYTTISTFPTRRMRSSRSRLSARFRLSLLQHLRQAVLAARRPHLDARRFSGTFSGRHACATGSSLGPCEKHGRPPGESRKKLDGWEWEGGSGSEDRKSRNTCERDAAYSEIARTFVYLRSSLADHLISHA